MNKPPRSVTTPPVRLETGDRLSRHEFHRRYCLRPDLWRAELIGGVVYVPLPERFEAHNTPQTFIVVWLGNYALLVPGVRAGSTATIFLDADTEVQTDGFLFRVPPPYAGAARVRADDYIEGAPQLVVEVAASSVERDLGVKFEKYRQAGVLEYLVWRVLEGAFDWFRLRDGQYVRIEPDENGVIESDAFPGLRLNITRLLSGDFTAVLG